MNLTKTGKAKQTPKSIGRPLLVWSFKANAWRFLRRSETPPNDPCLFIAREPFTILGIDPRASRKTIAAELTQKQRVWKLRTNSREIPAQYRAAMNGAIDDAVAVLTNDCLRYRAFARHYTAQLTQVTPERIQKKMFQAVLKSCPEMRKREALRKVKGGGIFSASMLAAFVLAIVIMSVPVGGFTIFGLTLFAATIIASWGPIALLPSLTIGVLGAVGAYYYRRHRNVFAELQAALGSQVAYLEEVGRSFEDRLMLSLYGCYVQDSRSYTAQLDQMRSQLVSQMDETIAQLVREAVSTISQLVTETTDAEHLTAETFLKGLGSNPDLMRQALATAVGSQMKELTTLKLSAKKEE